MTVDVVRNEEQSRYEIQVDGEVVGRAEYRDAGDRLVFTHTEVDEDREGEGLGGQLAEALLRDLRERGERIEPRCPFIAGYLARHPEHQHLVVDGFRLPVPD